VVVLVSSALQHLNVFRVGASLSSGKGGADSKAQNHENSPVQNVMSVQPHFNKTNSAA
jgi:hypothetical protein